MGIAERREREKEQRKADIIAAAEKIFFERGLSNATMDDVAEEAELAKATLYLYFKSKDDLYVAVFLRGCRILLEKFEEAVASADDGLSRVAAIGRAYIKFAREYPDYFNAMVYFDSRDGVDEESEYTNECKDVNQGTMNVVANAVASGVADGSIRPDLDPMQTAVILWAQTTGVLQVLSIKGDAIETKWGIAAETVVETHFTFVENALRRR